VTCAESGWRLKADDVAARLEADDIFRHDPASHPVADVAGVGEGVLEPLALLGGGTEVLREPTAGSGLLKADLAQRRACGLAEGCRDVD